MGAARTNTHKIIVEAYQKGYRVSEDGVLIGLKGFPLVLTLIKGQRYPSFSVHTKYTKSGVGGVPAHSFAAYCFYGEDSFVVGVVCRHGPGGVLDISKKNLTLGTHSQNNMDKPKGVRVAAAVKARASQGRTPKNAKLTSSDVFEIKKLSASGVSYDKLKTMYGVSKSTIANVVKERLYV